MNDDHLPAPGQYCPVCHGEDHLECWDDDRNPPAVEFELFTQVHDVIKRAAA